MEVPLFVAKTGSVWIVPPLKVKVCGVPVGISISTRFPTPPVTVRLPIVVLPLNVIAFEEVELMVALAPADQVTFPGVQAVAPNQPGLVA